MTFKIAYQAATLLPLAAMLLLSSSSGIASELVRVRKVTVLNELGRGVKAEIRIIDLSEKDTHFAYTDETGVAVPDQLCSKKTRLYAKPGISVYRPLGNLPYCSREVILKMQLPKVASALNAAADQAFIEGRYGLATMLYTEASARFSQIGSDEAGKVELKAYDALGKRFKLSSEPIVFDPKQEKFVLSKTGVNALIRFQRSNKLPVTGALDAKTIRLISKQALFPHIKEAYGEVSSQKDGFSNALDKGESDKKSGKY